VLLALLADVLQHKHMVFVPQTVLFQLAVLGSRFVVQVPHCAFASLESFAYVTSSPFTA
jgi:hypothetical protein